MESFSISDIEKQLQLARQNLLDLTMRNRLINYPPSKSRTIKIIEDDTVGVYDFLVLKGKSIEIRSFKNITHKVEDNESSEDLEAKKDRGYRYTELSEKEIEKRIFTIYQKARTVIEEQGYTVLFLATGFIHWLGEEEYRLAPLILIPVELYRIRVGGAFKLRWTGEDIITNISLQAKLKEIGVALPDFEMPDTIAGVEKYLKKVQEVIDEQDGWQFVDDIYLDFFSFTKFVMYNDLAPEAWPKDMTPAEHPLIQAIFYSKEKQKEEEQEDIDFNVSEKKLFHVMDTDASQMLIIEGAKKGKNLVVEGPPGTGKSQTITNIIAAFMAEGKSVLFVSEKMAALEVVKSRLDKVGLGDFCLELHSRKSRKQDVLNELKRTLSLPTPHIQDLEEKFVQIEHLREELNEYVDIIKNPIGDIGLSPFDLNCMREAAHQHFGTRSVPRIDFDNVAKVNLQSWEKAKSVCIDFAATLALVYPVSTHPWKSCFPGVVMPSDEEKIRKQLQVNIDLMNILQNSLQELQETTGVCNPENFCDLDITIKTGKLISQAERISKDVLSSREWENPTGRPQHLIEDVEKILALKNSILEKFEERVLQKDIPKILEELKRNTMKLLGNFNSHLRYLRWDIRFWYKEQKARSSKEMIVDLEQVNDYLNFVHEIRQKQREGENIFDFLWQNELSNPSDLRDFMESIKQIKFYLSRKTLSDRSLELLNNGIVPEKVNEILSQIIETKEKLEEGAIKLLDKIGTSCEKLFQKEFAQISLDIWQKKLKLWLKESHHLRRWSQYQSIREQCSQIIAHAIVEITDQDLLESEDVIPCLEVNLADALLEHSFHIYPFLANFISELHESKIKRFSDLDKEIIYYNRYRLTQKLHAMCPEIVGGASPQSEAGILLSEFNRKRAHMPIRRLMTLAGNLIQKIKPVFMMSPLSIAQFLDPRNVRFDIIIFDEASQVRPEDALGALLRGNQVVVMGDSQQLPPTSFFDHIIDETESDIASISDMESILHQCKRTFASRMLTNHYRSRHESLIAVSNNQYYHNNLTVYPSPIRKSNDLGLHLVHLKDTIYDRGNSRINLKEAKAVAKAVTEHYRYYPQKSLGVGTFNVQQQQAILQEIELEILQHPELEEVINDNVYEPLFVKNLETIQGDERDVIFLSMGYGFDQYHKLSHNFGPLNQEGGERRLNVLISRAREKCVVFSNFLASNLKVDSQSPLGLQVLKIFLDFAQNHQLRNIDHFSIPDLSMRNAIEEFIEQQGYKVKSNVGYGTFRVDLAIVHPEKPDTYSLGIEIDGTKYLDMPFTRERDRLRAQILANLGWSIHNIWLPDWYRNKEETENTLLKKIEECNHRKNIIAHIGQNDMESVETENVSFTTSEFLSERKNENLSEKGNEEIQEYKVCNELSFKISGDINQEPDRIVVEAIGEIVSIEGPIHFDELIRRIRVLWEIKRVSPKMTQLIEEMVQEAEKEGRLVVRDSFLWPLEMLMPSVRRRFGDPAAKIELICKEEIIAAIKLVIKRQHATKEIDLIKQSTRYLGFRTVTRATNDFFMAIINELIESKDLVELANGMIDLVP